MPRPRRVVVAGVGHYHAAFYPNYLELLTKHGCEIVGVSDPDESIAAERASRCVSMARAFARGGVRAFIDYREMIEHTRPDFVLALGRHVDMPELCRYLIDTRIPFLMEKPWGVDAATVVELAELVEASGVWAAVPFSMRYSPWAELAKQMYERGELGEISHGLFRMMRPGVQRYLDQDCPWMLSKAEAGGGVLLNLGVHGFDLCRYITGEEPEVVSAVTSRAACSLEVEDYAFVTLRTPSGAIFHTEVGYTLPVNDGDDGERTISGTKALLRETPDGVRILSGARDEVIATPAGYVGLWERVVVECLDALERGDPPPASARDCARAVQLTFDAYTLAGEPVAR